MWDDRRGAMMPGYRGGWWPALGDVPKAAWRYSPNGAKLSLRSPGKMPTEASKPGASAHRATATPAKMWVPRLTVSGSGRGPDDRMSWRKPWRDKARRGMRLLQRRPAPCPPAADRMEVPQRDSATGQNAGPRSAKAGPLP